MMRTVTLPAKVCHCQNRPDAVCRKLPRCSLCSRALHPTERGMCASCKTLTAQRDRVRLCAAVTRKKMSHTDFADTLQASKIDEIRERLILLCLRTGETV